MMPHVKVERNHKFRNACKCMYKCAYRYRLYERMTYEMIQIDSNDYACMLYFFLFKLFLRGYEKETALYLQIHFHLPKKY